MVLDASAMVDLLTGQSNANAIRDFLRHKAVHVPAHFDAEVLSALGRLCRAGHLHADEVSELLKALRRAPFTRHQLHDLIEGAWARRDTHRLVDGLYVELAERLRASLVTTDQRLAGSYQSARLP
ncbi:type II toxin-antitoxin system VapC family toxin [Mycobacterium noviomagense]|uniref:Ribonuclease VapC n=1 Tax=Mycobacterium noviomagense TaxID=459858 RepID=A0ABX3T449_9MYCO|nr:PIN domain-containing protein [Mycobacterium noviomagense]ORB13219.1 VapC toxin family PIN domain ribonuclease [Mycobacterium noviomagense]